MQRRASKMRMKRGRTARLELVPLVLGALALASCAQPASGLECCGRTSSALGGTQDEVGPVTCHVLSPSFGRSPLALVAVDLDGGVVTEVAHWNAPDDTLFLVEGMTYDGKQLVAAAYDGSGFSWYGLDPKHGRVLFVGASESTLESAAWTGSDWLAPLPQWGGFGRYPTLEALVAGKPRCQVPGMDESRFTVSGGLIYGTSSSGEVVSIRNLGTGALVRTLNIAPERSSVRGLSVAGGAVHVLWGPVDSTPTLTSFDLLTGAPLSRWSIPGALSSGLFCSTRPLY